LSTPEPLRESANPSSPEGLANHPPFHVEDFEQDHVAAELDASLMAVDQLNAHRDGLTNSPKAAMLAYATFMCVRDLFREAIADSEGREGKRSLDGVVSEPFRALLQKAYVIGYVNGRLKALRDDYDAAVEACAQHSEHDRKELGVADGAA